MTSSVPQAVQSCHDLLLWIIPQVDKFPRARRFTLGERIETGLLTVLELLVEAAYIHKKVAVLQQANVTLETVRHLWRLAYELKVIALRQYEHGSKLIDELGRQVGGWLRSRDGIEGRT